MIYPPSLDTQFSGMVWLIGQGFMPGCTLTVLHTKSLPQVVPLLYVNERTVGWSTATPPLPGDVTLQVTNPTLLASSTLTLTVGTPAPGSGNVPQASGPSSVSSPFVGSVQLYGTGIESGAVGELRDATSGTLLRQTSLIRVSSAEARGEGAPPCWPPPRSARPPRPWPPR